MNKPEILVTRQIYRPALLELEREYTVHKLWSAPDRDAFIREVGPRVRGVVTTVPDGVSARDIDVMPKLEIISVFGRSLVKTDIAAAKRRGIIVTNVPHSVAVPVADLALGLLIAIMRRVIEAERYVRAGRWIEQPFPPGRGLTGKTCGIVGLGEIGRELAKRVQACGMSACYHGPREKKDVSYRFYADLEEMARASDCLVVACAATPATEKLIDARILSAIGPAGYLINVARGSIVDEDALIAALKHGQIAGAALDVLRDEPRVRPEFLEMDNVIVVPHIGSTIIEIREERVRNIVGNLRAHFTGAPLLTPVDLSAYG
ncbi:MAG: 2-hydroxyacid dehydrogenase [Burkholderiaceae bacterium]